jgi:AraC-like DNA-binding protein
MDALDCVLGNFHVMSMIYCADCTNRAPWGVKLNPSPQSVHFHAPRSGKCWIRVDNHVVELQTGDFAVLPHGTKHDVIDDPGTPGIRAAILLERTPRTNPWVMQFGGTGFQTRIICAGFICAKGAQFPLMAFLPNLIHLRADTTASLEPILALAENEMQTPQQATDVILARLAELLVVEAVRTYLKTLKPGEFGWLAALQDSKISRILALIHRDPAHPWTLHALSQEAAMSRSALTARFRDVAGLPIGAYIARLRMATAANLLQRPGRADLGSIADQVGYKSEAAFIRAFTRSMGTSPTRFRSPGS